MTNSEIADAAKAVFNQDHPMPILCLAIGLIALVVGLAGRSITSQSYDRSSRSKWTLMCVLGLTIALFSGLYLARTFLVTGI